MKYLFVVVSTICLLACGKPRVEELTIIVPGDEMKYDRDTLRCHAGSQIKLTLINRGTLVTMKHNVIVYDMEGQPRQKTLDYVGELAFKAGEASSYVPQLPGLLAHTPMAEPGQTVMVEFRAPAAGEYLYLCTFQPAHYKTMNGYFIVEP